MTMPGGLWGRSIGFRLLWTALLVASACALGAALSGCRARMVDVTIVNHGGPVKLMEFDYPDASFGVDMLASSSRYHYSFQIQGSGPVTLIFNDASGKSHKSKGPTVSEGEEGSLMVTIGGDYAVDWSPKLGKR